MGRQPKWQTVKVIGESDLTRAKQHGVKQHSVKQHSVKQHGVQQHTGHHNI